MNNGMYSNRKSTIQIIAPGDIKALNCNRYNATVRTYNHDAGRVIARQKSNAYAPWLQFNKLKLSHSTDGKFAIT